MDKTDTVKAIIYAKKNAKQTIIYSNKKMQQHKYFIIYRGIQKLINFTLAPCFEIYNPLVIILFLSKFQIYLIKK